MEVDGGPDQSNVKLSQGLVTWLASEGFLACVEGHIGWVLSVPLP